MELKPRVVSPEVVILDGKHHFSRIDIPKFQGAVQAQAKQGRDVIFNMTDIPYVDNLACAAIIAAKQIVRDCGHEMRLCGILQERVADFISRTSVLTLLPHFASEAEAIASLTTAVAATQ